MTDLYNGRVTYENENNGKNYQIAWEAGFFYGTDMWTVVAGAPNAAERHGASWSSSTSRRTRRASRSSTPMASAVRMPTAYLTDAQRARLPTSAERLPFGAAYDTDFWAENQESLEARFKAWLEQLERACDG